MKKYYKIVRNIRGRYYSYIMWLDQNGVACREYFVDEFTTPPELAVKLGYLLTCFKSKKYALGWMGRAGELWEVAVNGELKKEKDLPDMGDPHMLKPWNHTLRNSGWPPGTIMVEKIKLIRRVK